MGSTVTFYKRSKTKDDGKGRKRSLKPMVYLGPATLGVITIIIILLMSLLYLVQANSTATQGYEIEEEREKINKLESQSEKLKLEMAKLRSTNWLDEVPEKLNLKPLNNDEAGFIHLEDIASVADSSSEKDEGSPNLYPRP